MPLSRSANKPIGIIMRRVVVGDHDDRLHRTLGQCTPPLNQALEQGKGPSDLSEDVGSNACIHQTCAHDARNNDVSRGSPKVSAEGRAPAATIDGSWTSAQPKLDAEPRE